MKHISLVGRDVFSLHTVRKSRPHNRSFLEETVCSYTSNCRSEHIIQSRLMNRYNPPLAHKNSCYIGHVRSRSQEWQRRAQRTKDHTHTCQGRVCSVRRGLVWFQAAPSWIGRPGRRRARRSWLRGFCRAALCRLLQETDCSGSLGSSLAWRTDKEGDG